MEKGKIFRFLGMLVASTVAIPIVTATACQSKSEKSKENIKINTDDNKKQTSKDLQFSAKALTNASKLFLANIDIGRTMVIIKVWYQKRCLILRIN